MGARRTGASGFTAPTRALPEKPFSWKWHQAGGPDVESNGIALCSLHHKMFDRGAFTVSPELELRVSELVNGAEGLEACLLRFHGKGLRGPQRAEYRPEPRFLEWQAREVFHGPARG